LHNHHRNLQTTQTATSTRDTSPSDLTYLTTNFSSGGNSTIYYPHQQLKDIFNHGSSDTSRSQRLGLLHLPHSLHHRSDALWPSILKKLNSICTSYRIIWYALNYNPATTYPATQSFDYAAATPEHVGFKNIITSDPALYGNKSIDDIANFFSDYLDAVPATQRLGIAEDVCLVIDEEVL